jgi:type VI secretion system protein ImpM
MRCGLYGKLPSKRDFIAVNIPRDFLKIWEPWMQAAVSASRQALGDHWQNAFLTAPIWRFWLGTDLCGVTVAGAIMSSMDGVGRYFPLVLIAYPEDGASIPPPELDAQNEWFTVVENLLLSVLEPETAFETITANLAGLTYPSIPILAPVPVEITQVARGSVAKIAEEQQIADVFRCVRATDYANAYAGATFWWTIGGGDYRPLALSVTQLPDPYLYGEMLTGRFTSGLKERDSA